MDDAFDLAAQPHSPNCGTVLRTRAYSLYCGGCNADVLDTAPSTTGSLVTPAELALEMGRVEHKAGARILHCLHQRYPRHLKGSLWLLTPAQADDARKNVR